MSVDESIDFLTRAIQHGTVSASWMRNDVDLEPLHGDARYHALLKQQEAKATAART